MESETIGRNAWTFNYSAGEVLRGCMGRVDYHTRRLAHWKLERDNVEKEMREHGVTFHEPTYSGGGPLQAKLDESLSTRLSECRVSISYHAHKLETYSPFLKALQREDEGRLLWLTADDVDFFFTDQQMRRN